MKNIHIIPTDKPSRVYKHLGRELKHTIRYFEQKGLLCINQHIYITSDEEIKEGDWFYDLDTKYVKVNQSWKNSNLDLNGKKIILTTDQDLIKDGVQEIDEEYLEWFVKNPSCEEVKVINNETGNYREFDSTPNLLYKIIIPKEEPKKEVTGVDDNRPKPNYCYAKEQGHGEIGCVFPACHCGLPIKQEEPLQETFEEAAERESQLGEYDRSFESTRKNYFIKGAKWQQERMCIDIEVFTEELKDKIDSFEYSVNQNSYISDYIKEWFEQFKMK